MKKYLPLLIIGLFFKTVKAQDDVPDLKYREDQFYFGANLNVFVGDEDQIAQKTHLYGLLLGFIRDMPINKRRNIAIGVGLGYATNSYNSDIKAINGEIVSYDFAEGAYTTNKIETHILEVPIEFRWRTSTPQTYKFWRVYAGVKIGYVFSGISKYVDGKISDIFQNPDIAKIIYGGYLSFNAKGVWNIYVYYPFNNIFNKSISVEGKRLPNIKSVHIGLIFYLL